MAVQKKNRQKEDSDIERKTGRCGGMETKGVKFQEGRGNQ